MSEDLRARLTALIPVDCWVLRVPAADASCTAYVAGVIGGGGHGKGARFTEDMCCLPCRLRALLADPAPEAAREEAEPVRGTCPDCGRVNEFETPVTWPMALDCYSCGYSSGTEMWKWELKEPSQEIKNRLHVMKGPQANAEGILAALATPADLPVATGVTTEDEGGCVPCDTCGRDQRAGWCLHPAPAPVVSAGDEGVGPSEIDRVATLIDQAVMAHAGILDMERDELGRIAEAILASDWLAARVAEAGARAWDEAVRECHDLGWLHDYARSDAIERNPYRKATQ